MERQKIRQEIDYDIDLSGSLENAIVRLQSYTRLHPECSDFFVDTHYCYECSGGLSVSAYRLETDKELERRKKQSEAAKNSAKKRKQNQDKRDRELYEKLKKRFA